MENLDTILRRIDKLMSMAERTEGNENEAATAAMMAAKLMEKYQIDNQDIIIRRLSDANEFCETQIYDDKKVAKKWIGILSIAIHYLFDVNVTLQVKSKNPLTQKASVKYTFRGFKDDVAVAIYAFDSLMNMVILEAKKCLNQGKISGAGSTDVFKFAAVSEIQRRAKVLSAERHSVASGSRELMLAKGVAVANHFGKQRTVTNRSQTSNSDAEAYGRESGANMDLNRRGVNMNSNQLSIGN